MIFNELWNLLACEKQIQLQTKSGKLFTVSIDGDSITYEPQTGQIRTQTKENLQKYFILWFQKGLRGRKHFRNFGPKKSPSTRYTYFSAMFLYFEHLLSKKQNYQDIDGKNHIEHLHIMSQEILHKSNELLKLEAVKVKDIKNITIPKRHGVYLFCDNIKDVPCYVGSATGKMGLYGRIYKNHLQASYQKSVFRKALIALYNLEAKEGSVNYIRENYNLRWIECSEIPILTICAIESLVIATLRPSFNKERC